MDLDLIEKVREHEIIMIETCKQRMTRRFNSKLAPRQFEEGDLVWRACGEAQKPLSDGKFATNWEGSFMIERKLKNEAYKLEELSRKVILRT